MNVRYTGPLAREAALREFANPCHGAKDGRFCETHGEVHKSESGTSPAGWHPDPTGRHTHRYWDGERWTDDISDNGKQGKDADLTPASVPPVAAGPTQQAGFTPKESGMSLKDYTNSVALPINFKGFGKNAASPSQKIKTDLGFGNKDVKQAVETAGAMMNNVIAVPAAMADTLIKSDKLEKNLNGFYQPLTHDITINERPNHTPLPEIVAQHSTAQDAGELMKYETVVHEFGHHLQNSVGLDLGEWEQVVGKSRRIADIAELGRKGNKEVKGYTDYLLNSHEVFARTWLQYVDEKNNRLLEDWGGEAERSFASPPEHLWDPDDFAPIFETMDRMFERAGMLRYRTKPR